MMKRLLTLFLCLTLLVASFPMFEEGALAASAYYIEVDITNQIVTVYESGNRTDSGIVRQMICSTGAPSTPTPQGTFILPEKKYAADRTEWKRVNGAWAQWCTRIRGSILFHSLPVSAKYGKPSAATVAALGSQASHGCVRLRVADAKWIALNCPVGTKTKIFKSGNRDNELRALLLNHSFYRGNETYEHFLGLDNALKQGSSGERVVQLQARLNLLGYDAGTADGHFGANTRNAVLAFQKACGVKQNGYVTERVWNLLFSDDAPHAPIAEGSSGLRVQELQKALTTLKFYSGEISGVYDAATIQAVKAYQSANNLTANGKMTDSLRKAILAKAGEVADRFGDIEYNAVMTTGTRQMAKVSVKTSLNLRKSASASSKSLGKLKNGAIVIVLKKGSAWSQVQSGSTVGYCKNSYLKFYSETYTQLEYQPANPDALPTPSPAPVEETLTIGSAGPAVSALQSALKDLKLYSDDSGSYDEATADAVKAFQSGTGLTADGIATPALQKAIIAKAAEVKQQFAGADYELSMTTTSTLQAKVKVKSSLNLRKSASASSKSLGKLKNGAIVTVLKKGSAWSQVQSGDLIGYCKNTYLTFRTVSNTVLGYKPAPAPTPTPAPTATPDPNATPKPAPSNETLTIGSAGQAVTNLQRALKELKLYNGELSGSYDEATAAAVKTFQSGTKLTADGKATPAVQKAIFDKADAVKQQFAGSDYQANLTTTSTLKAKVKVSSYLNLRKSASSSSKSLSKLKNGAVVLVLEKGSSWSKVQSGKLVGYCKNTYLKFNTVTSTELTYSPVTETPAPVVTPDPTATPAPSVSPETTVTVAPSISPETTVTIAPSQSPEVTADPTATATAPAAEATLEPNLLFAVINADGVKLYKSENAAESNVCGTADEGDFFAVTAMHGDWLVLKADSDILYVLRADATVRIGKPAARAAEPAAIAEEIPESTPTAEVTTAAETTPTPDPEATDSIEEAPAA